ncbi:hypothetical protein [Vibrio cyclitrophicus]|uniref:hypothetical protein n=1 Tax=Vibrio cyclitrophicus TaxID=47951 RepID=UPI003999891C
MPVKPLRRLAVPFHIQRKIVELVPWTEKLFNLPVHSFVTLDKDWEDTSESNSQSGYWYCAGDYCSTDEETVFGFEVDDADIGFATCLAKPGVKLDNPRHDLDVIGGSYLIDFVCHNIANRVLFSSKENITLVDTTIPITGYKSIVNSPLGIYGRNRREWSLIIDKCTNLKLKSNDPDNPEGSDDPKNKPQRTKAEEIELIHLRASGGNIEKARNITDALRDIDQKYANESEKIYQDFDNQIIGVEQLNTRMENLLASTISDTERTVSRKVAKAIYGDYFMVEGSSDESEGGNGGGSGGFTIIEASNDPIVNQNYAVG